MENGLTTLASIARRALAASSYNKNLITRCYCSSPPPNNKLFVAGLSWSVDEKSLLDAFSGFGEVAEVLACSRYGCPNLDTPDLACAGLYWGDNADDDTLRILYDKHSGRSRGFGFVNFTKGGDAISAKDAMDGKAFLGRPLRISFALEKVRGGPIVVPRVRSTAEFNNNSK